MALSSHELYLILRARDEASRVLRSFGDNMRQLDREAMVAAQNQFNRGAALATGGVAVAAAGLLAIQALDGMTDSAMEYNQQAAQTLTQVDGVKISLEQLKDMGREIGRDIPVQFGEIQGALYDIFSSIETDAPGARMLLEGISKASVAGATSMETTGRAAIAILNAYKKPATEINAVNDVMFQLVRKGVGTYEEFASTIGRAIPSAVKAGQSVESLSGMMAFLTRNGLSAAMASSSAARALDAISKPKTIERLKEMGVAVSDANGNFRPMSDIMGDLRTKMAGMNQEAKAAALQELFKGSGGTIQAMRFFNLAVDDGNQLLQQLTGDMNNAGGAAQDAYAIMANTPQAQIQLMANRYEILKTTIGDQLLPAKIALAEAISKVLKWFTELSPEVQKTIAHFAAFAAVALVLIGIVMAIVGLFLMFSAAAVMAGTTLGAVLLPVGLIIAALIAVAAAVYLIIRNWDTIKAAAVSVWEGTIWPAIQKGEEILKRIWNAIFPVIKAIGQDLVKAGTAIKDKFMPVWDALWPIIVNAATAIKDGVVGMIDTIRPHLDKFTAMWPALSEAAGHVWNVISKAAMMTFGVLKVIYEIFKAIASFLLGVFGPVLGTLGAYIAGVFGGLGEGIKQVFLMIGNMLGALIDFIAGFISLFLAIINGDWAGAWKAMQDITQAFGDFFISLFVGLGKAVWGILKGFVTGVINFFKNLWDVLVGHSIVPDMINAIIRWFFILPGQVLLKVAELVIGAIQWFASLPGKVMSALGSMASRLFGAVSGWFGNMIRAASSGIGSLMGTIGSLPGRILGGLGNMGSLLYSKGKEVIQGLINGIGAMAGALARKASSVLKNGISRLLPGSPVKDGPLRVLNNGYAGGQIMKMLADGMNAKGGLLNSSLSAIAADFTPTIAPVVGGSAGAAMVANGGLGSGGPQVVFQAGAIQTQEVDPVKHAADLGFEIARRVGA